MISFELTEEQEIARSTVREFAGQVLRPLARQADVDGRIEDETLDQLWSLGVVQSMIDQDGAEPDQSAILSALLLEELGWADAAFGVALASPLGFVRAVKEQGSAAQKEALLPLFTGDRYHGAAVALAEPGLIDNGIEALSTKAEADPAGYRLTGAKVQVPLGDKCSHFLVIAQHDGKPDAFIVPRDAAGVVIDKSERQLGLSGLGSVTLRLDNVVLGHDARLGENHGCDVQRIVDAARVGASSILVGLCRGVYDHSVVYTKERHVHGSALAQKQSVAFRLVDMFVETEASRWMCWRAATEIDKGQEATRSAALAQSYTREQATWIADEGVQLMGGHGFMRANPVELWFRNARTLSLLEGTASV
ncbi:acyl-CoA dehydrogenase family protein [Rhizorhabdus dicambivorans]|uniref:Acyl-CoA dehydrogenase n=1 Tax=Rhizorhabdus dicambivorans TaxID=1850238 RepID=A0A2A4FWF9_9SPHN|nr:acyl-CoA dehydrogenase family protein [Rhizorhabdus dicambivorans]ATE63656.1 acyl-CoA dehydrogenase [Rhizorhabdus dicambivorans]PCE42784.1 acyl-CoA dehydrogenase [Rhizorhabdus dicambivorans]